MKRSLRRLILLAALALVLSSPGCQPTAAHSLAGGAGQSGEAAAGPLASAPNSTPAAHQVPRVVAPLPDPSVGLASLKNYRIVLTTEVMGSLDGQPYQRQTRIEYLHSAAGNEEIKEHIIGSGEVPFDRHLILHSGAVYEINETGETCAGQALEQPGSELFARPDTFLMPVMQGELDGSETINDIPARHYRLEAGSLPLKSARGELWLAEDGGQIVRYRLEAPASSSPTGKGLEASQSWLYDLTLTGSEEAVLLPPICQAVLADIPVPADAEQTRRLGGLTHFHSRTAAGEVFDFYQEKLALLGWQVLDNALPEPVKFPYPINAEKERQWLTIWLDESDSGGLDVDIARFDLGAAGAQAEAPAAPAQVAADPTTAGLPEDIPLLPSAYNLKTLSSGALVFFTTEKLEDVSAYYAGQMEALGWETLRAQVIDNGKTVTWVKEKRQVMCTVTRQDGVVQVMMVQINTR